MIRGLLSARISETFSTVTSFAIGHLFCVKYKISNYFCMLALLQINNVYHKI